MHENNRTLSFRCSEYELAALDALVTKSGTSRADVLRKALSLVIAPVLDEAMSIAVARHTAKADVGELVVQALREMADTARPDRLVSRG
jgi:hypothetical protein